MPETVNYSEHYGLAREPGKRVTADHSWQSDVVTSRFTLIELLRHTDHQLESHKSGKYLLIGYFGMIYQMMIPPLWFKMLDTMKEG